MPEIGEITRGIERGYESTTKYIWHACPDCDKTRWVELHRGQPKRLRCRTCANKSRFDRNKTPYNSVPTIGEIRYSRDLGYKERRAVRMINLACPDCGKERWTILCRAAIQDYKVLCRSCSTRRTGVRKVGNLSNLWKGGRADSNGYAMVRLYGEDEFFRPMACKNGYILEHRLVMAKSLGRCLHQWELVHHKDGNKRKNVLSNLQLVTDQRHQQITILENRIRLLDAKVDQLGNQVRLLLIQNRALIQRMNAQDSNMVRSD